MPRRYFVSPYPDYDGDEPVTVVDRNEFGSMALATVRECVARFPACATNCDGGLYVGIGGLAYALWHVAERQPSSRTELLAEARRLIDYHVADADRHSADRCSFLLGQAGLYVVAALIASSQGDVTIAQRFVARYIDLAVNVEPLDFLRCGGDELFVGRAGYLCGLLNLRLKLKLNESASSSLVNDRVVSRVASRIVQSGSQQVNRRCTVRGDAGSRPPLVFAYYGTQYLGAAHGLAGILQMLLSFPAQVGENSDSMAVVRQTVDWLVGTQLSNGNFPCTTDELLLDRGDDDQLIHWCHGAPGTCLTLLRAYKVWKNQVYLQAAKNAAELVWQKGLLKKGPGVCHGVAGNGYVFLLMYQLTREPKYLYRARRFAQFMQTDDFKTRARVPDAPYSLFEGLAGTACFYADLMAATENPDAVEFPLLPVSF